MEPSRDSDPINDLRSYADGLVEAAPVLDVDTLHLVDGARVPRRPHRFTAPVAVAMSLAAMLLVAEVGVAVVANSAVPGDQIYGIDLLIEDALILAGIPIDTSTERLDEAGRLLEKSEVDQAIRTARVGYQEMDEWVGGAATVHLVQAERALTQSTDPGTRESVRATLAELLSTTKGADLREVKDVRAINDAALLVERAAQADSRVTP